MKAAGKLLYNENLLRVTKIKGLIYPSKSVKIQKHLKYELHKGQNGNTPKRGRSGSSIPKTQAEGFRYAGEFR